MSEIAKCPLCGESPAITTWFDEISHSCCGVTCESQNLWNQYAAAMELAKAHKKADEHTGPLEEIPFIIDTIYKAERKVKEVFK